MKIFKFLFLTLSFTALLFCSRDSDSSSDNAASGSVTIRYELVCSSSFKSVPDYNIKALSVVYTNETGQFQQIDYNGEVGSTWSKTVKVTTSQRPLLVMFSVVGVTKASSGNLQLKVYVNNELRGSNVFNIQNLDLSNSGLVNGYINNIIIY